jgi:hypothetical protein
LANFSGLGTQNASTAFNAGTVPHEYGGLEANVSAYSGVPLISGGSTIELKYNRAGTTAPGPTNNTTQGYTVGSRWVDTVADEEYVCLESTSLTAVWKRTTVVDAGGGSASQLSELSDVATAPNTANYVLATPNGSSGEYSGRALAAADIPSLPTTKITSGTLLHERGGLEADVSSYAGIPLINNGATSQLKMNLGATAAPGVGNDNTQGYTVGSRWVNIQTGTEYVCVNTTTGAASWIATTTGGSSGASALIDLTDVDAAASTQNFVLATPSSGTGAYSGRLLAASDIPAIPASKITSGTLPLTQGGLGVNANAFSGIPLITGSTTVNLKCNFTATTDPAVSDNSAFGYVIGSRWVNTYTFKEFVCVKASNPATWSAVMADPTTTAGDLIYRNPSNTLTRLPMGTTGQVLKVTGSNTIAWAAEAVGFVDPTSVRGDLIYRNPSDALARLPAGAAGTFLKVTASGTLGWATIDPGLIDPTNEPGDLLYRSPSDVLARLPIGTTGQFLKVTNANTGTIAWADSTGMSDPMTTAGDLIYRNTSNTTARLPIGAPGRVLTVSNTTGLIGWQDATPITTKGDIIYGGTAGVPTRLGIGTPGQQLRVHASNGILEYFTPTSTSGGVPSAFVAVDYASSGYQILSSDMGKMLFLNSGMVLTLPSSASAGAHFWLYPGSYGAQLQSSTANIFDGGGGGVIVLNLTSGEKYHMWYTGTYWVLLSNATFS